MNKPAITPAMIVAAVTGVDMSAAMPGGIEASEKLGQITFVRSTTMPAKMYPNRSAFEALGFVFGAPIEGDHLFLSATLPPGWTKQGTDHDMWSKIVDETGRERVEVFYKAEFYDRRANATIIAEK